MSWRASQWAVSQRTGSAAGKAVLLVLGEAADAAGHCFLGQEEIGRRSEMTRRSVWTQMGQLERRGLLRRERRSDGRGNRTSDAIFLSLVGQPQGEEVAPSQREEVAPSDPAHVQSTTSLSANSDVPTCTSCTGTGTEPKEEPEEEPIQAQPILALAPLEPSADPIILAFAAWNETAARCGLSQARDLTTKRRDGLRRMLKARGVDGWRDALRLVEARPFLQGQNDSGWQADLDFLLRPDKLTKLLEGGYANRPGAGGRRSGPGSWSAVDEQAAFLEDERTNR